MVSGITLCAQECKWTDYFGEPPKRHLLIQELGDSIGKCHLFHESLTALPLARLCGRSWLLWAGRRRSGMLQGNVCLACNGRDGGDHLGQLSAGEPRIPDTPIHTARLLSRNIPLHSMSVITGIFLSIPVQRTQHVSSLNPSSRLSERGAP